MNPRRICRFRFDGGAQTGNSAQQQMVAGGNKPKQEPVVIGEKVKPKTIRVRVAPPRK